MNVIITMAGHSKRFKKEGYTQPKFLIKIDSKMMIEHVINMFNDNDNYFLIINKSQSKIPGLINKLKKLRKKIFITIVKNHNFGPQYTVNKLKGINPNEECIISYCDLIVDWDYKKFLRDVYGYDGAISCFKGFHPASFGKTLYAYIKTNKQNEFLKIKEKESFTKNRHAEYASTGIYYFRSFKLFQSYASKDLRTKKNLINNEKYISLLFNILKKDKLKIKISEVKKFICLGTPYDLNQYIFWNKYFNQKIKKNLNLLDQTNIITMAGNSERFKKFGYKTSKPLINVGGQPMFIKSSMSYPKSKNWIFLPTVKDYSNYNLEKTIRKYDYFGNFTIHPIKKRTSGQAETSLFAKKLVNPNKPLLIGSCDYSILFSYHKLKKLMLNKKVDVLIWTYKLKNIIVKDFDAFAFCKTKNDKSSVTKIIEKKTISKNPENDQFVVGNFWFRKSDYFFEAIENSIKEKNTINGEYYIGNSLNYLIKKKLNIFTFPIEKFISYGNPFELKIYEFWEEYFFDNNEFHNS